MSTPRRRDDKYSTPTGVIYLFNLIVGTGALTLPRAVQECGVILGILLVLTLGFFSFMTATFIIEALAAANALSRKRYENEALPLVSEEQQESIFEITEKYEIGQMAVFMTPKWIQVIIYFCLCVYLFGDLAIYEVVIGTTASQVICDHMRVAAQKLQDNDLCLKDHGITVINVHRAAIAVFVFLLGPFVFFNIQKTKALQIFTIILRWVAFFVMLLWSFWRLYKFGAEGKPPLADPKFVPVLFGTSVYSFMCQHSIPGLLQPIRNKSILTKLLGFDYTCSAVFYVALSTTAAYTFAEVNPLFSLNFWEEANGSSSSLLTSVLAYYLALFPIFTLSTSFPIIAITLRNNFRALILRDSPPVWYYDRLLFPLLTILPPTILSLCVSDVSLLVGVVGSYAGAGVQYLIPCMLVQFARSQVHDFDAPNMHSSIFKHKFWPYIVYIWMILSLVLISCNYVMKFP